MDHRLSSKLISPIWIETHPPEDFLLFEVGDHARDVYLSGHIPRAIYLDTNDFERPPAWNRLPNDELEQAILTYGITHNKIVVLYTRGSTAAARVAVILLYAGVRDVRLLDGGFGAWLAAGYPVETGEHLPVSANTFGITIPARPEFFAGMDMVKKMLKDPDSVVVSVRSWVEYIGETSGYATIEPKGRIAGAVWGRAGSDKDSMEDYHQPNGTARPLTEIAENWRKQGITPEKRVAFYCGTGWRASEAFFYAYAMGWKNIAVYDGGWLEWSSQPENLIETGVPT